MNLRKPRFISSLIAVAIAAIFCLLSACSLPQVKAEDRIFLNLSLDYLGQYHLPQTSFEGTTVGGLSALAYDRQQACFYAVSDDASDHGPARFYTLKLGIDSDEAGDIQLKRVQIQGVTLLKDQQGQRYSPGAVDAEGIAVSPEQSVFIASEGGAEQNAPAFIGEFEQKTGAWRQNLLLPAHFLTAQGQEQPPQGIVTHVGFEALTLNPGGDRLFAATESALAQDIDPDHPESDIKIRFLHYFVGEPESVLISEHVYPLVPGSPETSLNGLVELMAIDSGGHFLSLERSFSPITGYSAQIYQMATGGATDVTRIPRLQGQLNGIVPIKKRLLLDLTQLGIPLENLEGMTIGPRLPNGRQSLLLVSDNNFNQQRTTQFLLLQLNQVRQGFQ
jgi:hypothetical protein